VAVRVVTVGPGVIESRRMDRVGTHQRVEGNQRNNKILSTLTTNKV
jgi:hypothetical protein